MQKIYVITGGPGVGKTTVITGLEKRGFFVAHECAREIIKEETEKGTDVLPWADLKTFQEKVSERQIENEESVTAEAFFVDRGVVDGLAYLRIGGLPSNEAIEKFGRGRYAKVFLLVRLPFYENDPERKESLDVQEKIHDEIKKAYEDFGYSVITVPLGTPDERVEYILKNI